MSRMTISAGMMIFRRMMFGMTLSVKKMCWSKKFGITSGTILGTMHTTVWNDNVRENNVCDNNI